MRKYFVIAAVVCLNVSLVQSQARFVDNNYKDYFNWFHEQSQVENLYTDGAELITFSDVNVQAGACLESEIVTHLPIGFKVQNIVEDLGVFPEDEINGYHDLWFQVSGVGNDGTFFTGYIWGADLAKSWQYADVTGDGKKELAMLGISSRTRKNPTDINAEIKIVKDGKVISKTTVSGLCVFEECATSALLRILKDKPCEGAVIVEVSTMTIGCAAGIEKAYFFQTSSGNLEGVFHAELTTKTQFRNIPFEFVDEQGNIILCRFSHEDENFSPVWTTKKLQSKSRTIAKVTQKNARA